MATSMTLTGTGPANAASPPPLTGADTAFQGIGTVSSGVATIMQTPTLDTVTVSTNRTIIDFTPFDTATGGGPIVFLPNGRAGLFQNDVNSGVTNFTVLNRIIPTDATRAIRFDGTVQSRIANATGGSSPGGTILFYSPSGIIASASAVFDVGSLVLSAADVTLGANNNSFSFSGATPDAAVDVNAGATILAQGAGSYVALVAPRIIQSGTVKSDGSIGYVAAEAVDVTIQNNLFDISFVAGTDGTAVTHTGSTELTRALGDNSPQRIYVAAVPKNDAITMLISGSMGYSAATQASLQNGAVILSAGRGVAEIGVGGVTFSDFTPSTAAANIAIGTEAATIFNASLLTNATGDAVIAPAVGTTIQFNGPVVLNADRLAEVRAVANSAAMFDNDLSVSSNNMIADAAARVIALGETGYGLAPGLISIGGNLIVDGGRSQGIGIIRTAVAELAADLGRISVSGSAIVKASDVSAGLAKNAFGGNAAVRVGAAGSLLSATGLTIDARARGVAGFDQNGVPITGNATGGTANLNVAGGTFIPATINFEGGATSDIGGIATGGAATLNATGGTINLGLIAANVDARSTRANSDQTSPVRNFSGATGGTQTASLTSVGGSIQLDVTNTQININGDLMLNADAIGSNGTGGLQGGAIGINVNNGSLRVGDVITVSASVEETASAAGVEPGLVRGGTITVLAANNGDILSSAMNYDANAASGGDASGGAVSLTTNNGGSISSVGTLGIGAASTVRSLESAGDAVGGSIQVNINSGALVSGPLILDASAVGGDAIFGGIGGSATGGTARVNISGGDSTVEVFSLTTDATGGRGGLGDQVGGAGGSGTAGTSEINLLGGTTRTAALILTSSAMGGGGGDGSSGGTGGIATGGRAAAITSDAATLFLMKVPRNPEPTPLASSVDSSARGGFGGVGQSMTGGAGGVATGGTSILTLTGADIQPDSPRFSVDLFANSEAVGGIGGTGNASDGGAGGSATGGAAAINLINNHIDFNSVALSTRGSGGSGGGANTGYGALPTGGSGGNASGGAASVTIMAPATNMIATNIANLAIAAEAVGGSGGVGGNGGAGGSALNSGSATFTHTAGAVTIPVAILTTNSFGGNGGIGLGGNGGLGGNSAGGRARLAASGATTNLTANIAGVSAVARGGFGGDAQANSNTSGGNAGNATGGTAEILAQVGAALSLGFTASTDASAFGGRAGIGLFGGGSGGNAIGGTGRIDGTNALLNAALVNISSDATGGDGGQAGYGGLPPISVTGGNGGTGAGGVSMLANARFASSDSAANVTANGNGGNGGRGPSGGSGGNGVGGAASFLSAAGATTEMGSLGLTARANGGAGGSANDGALAAMTVAEAAGGAGGAGGNGSAGNASLTSDATATSLIVGQLIIDTAGIAGSGSNGGAGGVTFDGVAGNGGNGGPAGNATGGMSIVTISGGSAQFNAAQGVGPAIIFSGGFGASGGLGGAGGQTASGNGVAGNNGVKGLARGGSGSILVSSAQLSAPNIRFDSDARGPGDVSGGNAAFNLINGATYAGNSLLLTANAIVENIQHDSANRVTASVVSANTVTPLTATAIGGTASVSVNNATALVTQTLEISANAEAQLGTAQGGTANIFATGGTLTTPSTIATANGSSFVAGAEIGGRGGIIDIRSTRAMNGTAGVLNLGAAGLQASGFSTLVDNPEAATSSAAGKISIAANGGQTTAVNFTTLSAQTLGRNTSGFNPNNGIFLNVDQGSILATNAVTLLSDENIGVAAVGTGNLFVGNDLNAEALNTITISHSGRASIANTIFAANANFVAGTDFNAVPGSRIRSDIDLTIMSRMAGVSAGDLVAGDDIAVISNGTVNVAGLALTTGITAMGSESNVSIVTPGDATVNMIDAFGNFSVESASLFASSNIMAGEDVNLLTTGPITTQAISAGDDVLMTTNSGNIAVLSATARGTGPDDGMGDADVILRSTSGAITLGAARSNDEIILKSGGNIAASNLTTTGLGLDPAANRSNIIIDSGAAVSIDTINAQTSLAVRGTSVTGTNLIAGEDIALLASGNISVAAALSADDFSAASSSGNITLTGIATNAAGADDRTANFGYGEIGFLATSANGSRIDASTGYGNISLDMLNSAGATALMAGGSVTGGASTAGGLLS
ncbi:MAG: hypothetical protein AABY88_00780, partial [Pseudomonadota bacterium]